MSSTPAEKTYDVLFLCTGNSARSLMAEALLNTMGKSRCNAYSACSRPGGILNPLALERIKSTGCAREKLRGKSRDEFAAPDVPKIDFIITACDNAAATGREEQKSAIFSARQINTRVNIFSSLPK